MKIHSLQLQNFRGFEKLDLALDPSLTLLIGENGAGKTAILEGLAIALRGSLFWLDVTSQPSISEEDARSLVHDHEGVLDRERQWPVEVQVQATLDAEAVSWSCISRGPKLTAAPQLDKVSQILMSLVSSVRAGEPHPLPVVAYYGTYRLWPRRDVAEAQRDLGSRFDGYADALDAASSHRQLADWMFVQTIVELQRRQEVPQLRAVERAVCQCIEGATRFFFDVKERELVLEREAAEPLFFSMLSDGYRSMVALVADIAWRASVLNPHFGADAAARSEGVVLIDEIELHLHPRWQRQILGDLRRTFPRLQFVTTTHSPQVLASVRREEVRVFKNNALVDAQPFVEGRDTNSLLEDIFGVPERPRDVGARIDEMSRLLDAEKYEPGAKLLDALEAQLGPDDPAVIRARWILDYEAVPKEDG
jgi:predicted ATP-binding protein involved in virulence